MAQTTINVRIDEDLKKQFEFFCNETGLNISTAINMFVKTVVRENAIPFKIAVDPFYSEENMIHLKKAIKDLENGKGVEKVVNLYKENGYQNVKMKLYPEDRHEILKERDKDVVYQDILNFLRGN